MFKTNTLINRFRYYTHNQQKQESKENDKQPTDFFSNQSKIQEIPIEVLKKCLEFIPKELHPYFGFSLNIKADFFWQDFLSSEYKPNFETHAKFCQNLYFENPETRRLDLILAHKNAQEIIENMTLMCAKNFEHKTGEKIYFQKYFLRDDSKKTQNFFSKLIYEALKNTHSDFLNLELSPVALESISLEMLIEHCLDIFKNQIDTMTGKEKKNLSKQHIQEFIVQDIITLDEAKQLNQNALSCLENTTIQNLLQDQVITLTELATLDSWKITFALQIPMAENSLRSGHHTLRQLENISDICFAVLEAIILLVVFTNI